MGDLFQKLVTCNSKICLRVSSREAQAKKIDLCDNSSVHSFNFCVCLQVVYWRFELQFIAVAALRFGECVCACMYVCMFMCAYKQKK